MKWQFEVNNLIVNDVHNIHLKLILFWIVLNDKFTPPHKIFGRHEKVQLIKYLPKNIFTIPIVAVIIYRHKLLLLLKMHITKHNYLKSPIISNIFFYFWKPIFVETFRRTRNKIYTLTK